MKGEELTRGQRGAKTRGSHFRRTARDSAAENGNPLSTLINGGQVCASRMLPNC